MSKSLSNAASQEFAAMVKQAFQGRGGRVRDSVANRTNVVGDIYRFRLMAAGMAVEKITSQTDIVPMDINHTLISTTLKNYYAADYTDIFDQAEVNFDEKTALAESIALALKRREDQLVINALNEAVVANDNYVASNISGQAASLTVKAVLKAGEILDNAYADGQKYMLITPAMRSSLLQDAKVTDFNFVDTKPLASGELWEFAGFKFILIETTRSEGGLPKLTTDANGGKANDITAFAYVQNAVGLAIGLDMNSEINYIAEKTSWLTSGYFKAGAAVIDAKGVVKLFCNP